MRVEASLVHQRHVDRGARKTLEGGWKLKVAEEKKESPRREALRNRRLRPDRELGECSREERSGVRRDIAGGPMKCRPIRRDSIIKGVNRGRGPHD